MPDDATPDNGAELLPIRYYHGGRPGMGEGGELLPPGTTRHWAASELFPRRAPVRADRVFITPDLNVARIYAALYPHAQERGAVYEVVPVGPLELDQDCPIPGKSAMCERANIRSVIPMTRQVAEALRGMLGELATAAEPEAGPTGGIGSPRD